MLLFEKKTNGTFTKIGKSAVYFLAELKGFEPSVSCVTGRHVRPLHHSSVYAAMFSISYIVEFGKGTQRYVLRKSCRHEKAGVVC